MRAVKGKNKILSLISRPEARIYSMIEADGFISCESLSERDSYIAEELYQKNIIQKVRKDNTLGWKAYSNQI